MNLGTLNTIIALVVVLLILSLVVQSIQTVLKKIFKLKSHQIEESLKDLFDQAIGSSQPVTPAVPGSALAKFRTLFRGVKRQWSAEAERFKNGVLEQFRNVGRVTRFGNPVLDSLSKEDLLKVIAKLDLERYFPEYVGKLQELFDQIKALRSAIESIASNQQVTGVASAKISELRAIVTPLINDAQALVDNQQKVKPQVVFGDLLRLSKLEPESVLTLVTEAQTAVAAEIEKATQSSSPADVAALEKISASLTTIAKVIGDLNQKFDQTVAPLRGKFTQVDIWFDTVSKSFDERYTRHMRTVSICISIVLVAILNANFFTIYNNISTNEIQKNLIVDAGPKLLEEAKRSEAASQPSPVVSPTPIDFKKEADRTKLAIQTYVSTYEQFGFSPLSAGQIKTLIRSSAIVGRFWPCDGQQTAWGCTLKRDEKGSPLNHRGEAILSNCVEAGEEAKGVDCAPAWRPQSANEWWVSLKGNFTTVLGWAVMIVLLSVGAPFWQDALESLFGIKNLIRKKSATLNVETQSETDQTVS